MAENPEVEEQAVVEPQNGLVTSSGGVIPTLADLSYAKNSTPPAE